MGAHRKVAYFVSILLASLLTSIPGLSAAYSGPPQGALSAVGSSRDSVLRRYGTPQQTEIGVGGWLGWTYRNNLARTIIIFLGPSNQSVERVEYRCGARVFARATDIPCGTLAQVAAQEGIRLSAQTLSITMHDPRGKDFLGCQEGRERSGDYWVSIRTQPGYMHVINIDLLSGRAPPYFPFIWQPSRAFNPSTGVHETKCTFVRRSWRQDPPREGGAMRWWVSR